MASVLDIIKHYQRDIERHSDDEAKVLRCINKLFQLKVTVQHLQDTGVGRTVNALRKEPGEVGQAARTLVLKWKTMVAAEESDQEGDHRNDTSVQNGHGSGRESDDQSQHSKNSHEQHIGSKNSTPKLNYQELSSNSREHREINGNHSGSKRKYHSSEEEDHDNKKKSRHTSSSEDDHKKVVVKQEKLSDSESSEDDSDTSDSDSDSYTSESSREQIKPKTEIKKEIKKEKESPERQKSSHSSKHLDSNHDDRKKESSSSKKHEYSEKDRHSQHQPSKDVSGHSSEASKSSSHKHKREESYSEKRPKSDTSSDEKKESKSNKHSSEKRSYEKHSSDKHNSEKHSSDKHTSEKHSSNKHNSEKHSSDKHSSNSHKHSTSDRHKDSEKHSSKESKGSSHTVKVPEKHKSSSERDGKHRSKERSSSTSKEKHSSSSKDKSKDRSSSSKERSSHSSEKKHTSSESKSQSEKKHKSHDSSSEKKSKEKSSSSSSHKSKSSSSKLKGDVPKKKSKLSNSEESGEDGIDCGSGASFAEALGMMGSPSKSKKKSFKDINSPTNSFSNDLSPAALLAPSVKLAPLPQIEISALPEISPNYKPRPPPKALPHFSDEDAISAGISSKNQRTKVYSGNKVIGKITTLYEMCVHVLQEHIDALEFTGGVPYDILKPVIDRATPQQLFTLEHFNPYLMEDTDHLWQKFCEKSFRNKKRQELESWREMYLRCQEEQESKLRSLTANIKLTQEAKKAPIKQTKMAYVDSVVKPPRNVARKQAQHGTAFAASASPAARVASLSATPGILKGGRPAPPAPPTSASSFSKPKKAPLMQKALQFMRGRKR